MDDGSAKVAMSMLSVDAHGVTQQLKTSDAASSLQDGDSSDGGDGRKSSRGRVTSSESRSKAESRRIGIVVAHCREQMTWLSEVQRALLASHNDGGNTESAPRLELHVYEKCGSRDEDAWPRLGWWRERRTFLDNRGEECYAYLHYMRDMYHVLPDAVIFFQGDGVLDGRPPHRRSGRAHAFARANPSGASPSFKGRPCDGYIPLHP